MQHPQLLSRAMAIVLVCATAGFSGDPGYEISRYTIDRGGDSAQRNRPGGVSRAAEPLSERDAGSALVRAPLRHSERSDESP